MKFEQTSTFRKRQNKIIEQNTMKSNIFEEQFWFEQLQAKKEKSFFLQIANLFIKSLKIDFSSETSWAFSRTISLEKKKKTFFIQPQKSALINEEINEIWNVFFSFDFIFDTILLLHGDTESSFASLFYNKPFYQHLKSHTKKISQQQTLPLQPLPFKWFFSRETRTKLIWIYLCHNQEVVWDESNFTFFQLWKRTNLFVDNKFKWNVM